MYNLFVKRFFDIFISILFLATLSPLFILIFFSIKIFDNGPVLFTQRRIGKNGKEFIFFKFRTMSIDTLELPSDMISNPKISFIGQLMRRTNIDELPQLFNILIGDMSLVGPRPALFSQKSLIDMRFKNGSINCVPGLTGLAQINSYNSMPESKKAKFDEIYSLNISPSLDFFIIIRTFFYLLSPPPVY
tara:strand:- start:329 stop:895 length:567 start_codon:yes stop_codon:yes gene_type:complete